MFDQTIFVKRILRTASLVFAIPCVMPVALAAEGGNIIEEVVVTATRRETSQQSTPLSVTTVTPEQIEKRFMTDIRGVADLAPNVVMASRSILTLRYPGFPQR